MICKEKSFLNEHFRVDNVFLINYNVRITNKEREERKHVRNGIRKRAGDQ